MNNRFYALFKNYKQILLVVIFGSFYACSAIMEDRVECPEVCHIRFKYDYNMKYADAFANEVKQVSVFVFDENGRFLKLQTIEGDVLKTENFFITLDVSPGKYHLVVWAGLDGESFSIEKITPGISTISDLKVALNAVNRVSDSDLHPLWHGEIKEINVTGVYQEEFISLVKDTHRVRVVLQHINGKPVNGSSFRFEITDDNSLINYDNSLIPAGLLTYSPYITGQNIVGDVTPVETAYAEIHTSRLMVNSQSRLRIIDVNDNSIVIDIPLTAYLLLTELEGNKGKMSSQEYLDRQDEYSLIFFLDDNLSWLKTQIIINGWTVRFNSSEL
jgi:hypothetical protein